MKMIMLKKQIKQNITTTSNLRTYKSKLKTKKVLKNNLRNSKKTMKITINKILKNLIIFQNYNK